MDAEKTTDTVKSQEASPSSDKTFDEDFPTEMGECMCTDNEGCMDCAVKEYQEALKKLRDFSNQCVSHITKTVKNYHSGSANYLLEQSCDISFPQNRNCATDLKQNKDFSMNVRQNCDTDLWSQDFETSINSSQECDADLSIGQSDFRQAHEAENCSAEGTLLSRNSYSHSQQTRDCSEFQNCRLDPRESRNSPVESRDAQNCDSIQNPADSEQVVQNEVCDTDCDSDLVEDAKYSESSCNGIPEEEQLGGKVVHTGDSHSERSGNCSEFNFCCTDSLQGSQNTPAESRGAQSPHADLQQIPNCEGSEPKNACDVKNEVSDVDSYSNLLSESGAKDSEPFCVDGHEKCDGVLNHSGDCDMVVKSELFDICTDSSCQDLKRSRRSCKRKRDLEDFCPICGLTVRYSELKTHFEKEVENLSNVAKNIRKPRGQHKERAGVNITYVKVKCNRENRLAAKVARYAKKNDVHCPVCKLNLTGTETEINEHVLNCIGEDYDSDINVTDRDDSFEEYDFGEETRVRAISLVPGGHKSLHGYSSKSKPTDDDDDLNVDIDDTLTYGKPQYTELDVIHNTSNASEEKELEQLRRAVISDPAAEPHVIEGKKWSQNCEIIDEIAKITGSNNKNELKSNENEDQDLKSEEYFQKVEPNVISSLKERIKDLEQQKTVKCLICLEPFTKPVVSTTCWHVHCEECWLVSMGVKKLCPQCNMIVFPTDLRRIYL